MKSKTIKSNIILLITALIWGLAFTAQSVGMKYVGPFTFNGIRFILGAICIVPVMLFFKEDKIEENSKYARAALVGGIICGMVNFLGTTLQQIGLMYTTVGKAGFITGLYIVIVPIIGIFLKHHMGINSWIGVLFALVGLYLLCNTGSFSVGYGETLELSGAFFFAVQIFIIDHFSKKANCYRLAFFQYVTCGAVSLIIALFTEKITFNALYGAAIPILYGGLGSVGIAYTLQIIGQKNAKPSHAAIIMSMESVFGALGGAIILGERMGAKNLIGCGLMLLGMLVAQIKLTKTSKKQIIEKKAV
ncbi:drug/metabolite transporter (DMT)-like permease [Clostridium acetobutylicum]|uniref:Predicted permease n=1 Tax=Clostridium acetobutylicum (strain ATCC 824 / DSM 792 / JCM 1419 / IAM 19013 / LMG 5710 / NBRC 13948 / NRRL B-527 / VKM B-1787 / 2291 / W) TaxID=272562 RepID=Q97MW5_CLOAB|nr:MULTISPECIES: DMT family transporter [Clostridium]AAK78061.1 Predicted permease [Clostridium acetobutylicum ATCC 824]ADZ19119.1 permease [Clostridium acetobutylicum EA 2018]AEI33420.1 permease [Clostridium acetobutylicum DSM 1731]AWV81875.1 DMT family transporter [Clostridium acetobutylicum]MBC2395424.1 DMT family transporter [Clostridium acetobutylicum]